MGTQRLDIGQIEMSFRNRYSLVSDTFYSIKFHENPFNNTF